MAQALPHDYFFLALEQVDGVAGVLSFVWEVETGLGTWPYYQELGSWQGGPVAGISSRSRSLLV